MINGSFPAMGTTIEVWSHDEDGWHATRRLFEDMEAAFSRFRPDSELSRVNAATARTVEVSTSLASVLGVAALMRDRTGGLVDVGVGSLVAGWGYDRTLGEVVDLTEGPIVDEVSPWELRGATLVRPHGVSLDLGGIAKGWTADRAVELGFAAVVSAGGDIRSDSEDTVVPVDDGRGGQACTVALGVGALATSSTLRRRWKVGGKEVSHLIDPRTARPVQSPVVSASVVAETAAEAEAGAKAVLLLGADGLAWAAERAWIRSALVVWHDGSVFATTGMEVAA